MQRSAQIRVVGLRHVGESQISALDRTEERAAASEIHVIGDDHEIAGPERSPNPAGRVRHEQDVRT
jgi:hypothetical protein